MSRNWTSLQSKTIDFLRFPMAVAVVMLHHSAMLISDATGVHKMLCIVFQEGICRMAVPCFFMVSSYFFFTGLEKWDWSVWTGKLHRRVYSLLLPYILWNVIAFFAFWFYGRIIGQGVPLGEFYVSKGGIRMLTGMGEGIPLGVRAAPIDSPLWFVRDLMVYVLFSPLVFLLLHWTKALGMLAIVLAYLILPGIVPEGFVFFVIGTWFCLSGRNMLEIAWPHRTWLAIAAVLLLVAITWLYGHQEQVRKAVKFFFMLAGIATCFCWSASLLEREKLQVRPFLTRSSFFVFAAHEVLIVHQIARPLVLRVLPEGQFWNCVEFFLTPALGIGICLLLLFVLECFLPRTAGLLTGRRKPLNVIVK